jgi:hypothetical protein
MRSNWMKLDLCHPKEVKKTEELIERKYVRGDG